MGTARTLAAGSRRVFEAGATGVGDRHARLPADSSGSWAVPT